MTARMSSRPAAWRFEVEANAAAAAGAGRFKERHPEPVENPRRRGVDAGRKCRLDATRPSTSILFSDGAAPATECRGAQPPRV